MPGMQSWEWALGLLSQGWGTGPVQGNWKDTQTQTETQTPAARPRQKRDEVGSSCAVARFDRAVVRPTRVQRPMC